MSWSRSFVVLAVGLAAFVAVPAHHALAVTYTVDTTSDANLTACNFAVDDDCSLRGAINNANVNPGGDSIAFDLGPGTPTINVGSTGLGDLATIASGQPVTIDGNTGGATRIELNGTTAAANGLDFLGGSSVIESLVINRFPSRGIVLRSSFNTVKNSIIGLDATGTVDLGNTLDGISIVASQNTIGGPNPGDRNIISGNERHGINVGGDDHVIAGNYIGPDITGTLDRGNSMNGINLFGTGSGDGTERNIIGGTTAVERNVISGNNGNGIYLTSGTGCTPDPCQGPARNMVQGNYIGTNAAGDGYLGNTGHGIELDDANVNCIGGVVISTDCGPIAGGGNVISGNGGDGIKNTFPVQDNRIYGNFIGTNAAGTADLGNTGNGITLEGFQHTVGETVPEARNVIAGNDANGIVVASNPFGLYRVEITGNFIGVAAAGVAPIANAGDGIVVQASGARVCIGAITSGPPNHTCVPTVGAGNVISANGSDGIQIAADSNGNT
ncbi:MAG: hypothetical protein ACREUU_18265, partial [Gammaproteobacteria bacterium]